MAKIFIASVKHRHGFGAVGGGPTREDAHAALASWARQFWDTEAPDTDQPGTESELIDWYFGLADEEYDISECEVSLPGSEG